MPVIAKAVQSAEIAQVFHAAEFVVEHGSVRHVTDFLFCRNDLAARRLGKSGDDAQERGFAGTVFSENGIDTSGVELGSDFAQGSKAAKQLSYLIERDGRL